MDRRKVLALLALTVILAIPRICFMFTDPHYRTFFVEEKASGYAARNKALFDTWDSGGGRYQTAAYMPAATVVTYASFRIFGIGMWQLRLPFMLASVVAFFCLGLVLIRYCELRPALLALAALGASPLLMAFNSMAINENLFLAAVGIVLLLLSELECESSPAKESIIAVLLGLCASFAPMVKINGGLVVLSVIATLSFGCVGSESRKRVILYFFLGGFLGLAILLLYIIAVPGIRETLDMYAWANEIWVAQGRKGADLSLILYRLYSVIPKYLNAFLGGVSLFGILGSFLLPFNWRKQRLAVQFSLISLLLCLFTLPFDVLLYHKRFAALLLPFFLLAVVFGCNARVVAHGSGQRRFLFILAVGGATALTVIAALSSFKGHPRVVQPWAHSPGAGYRVAAIILIPLLAAVALGLVRRPGKIMHTAFLIMCGIVILRGTVFFANHHWRTDGDKLGKSVAALVGEGSVVADEQAFRYFGYYSKAKVRFVHENDLEFPEGVIDLAREQSPEFIVACDAYKPMPDLVSESMSDYEPVGAFQYSQPSSYFSSPQRVHRISVFQLRE